ncbi:BirA family biotin operon repressor/biotin-[acetyl-CoA-carboxylase] ligase [Actinopolyspora biskrensis]|uniref:biotin--[biotin carboxyl-carrier protein] ligase n=1 Tax=Actinopolyspora biskrensis TaxID=1470178 RepID=A0A852Z255_9ACTN|nr:biotin--[acetyl-CoA-carboxylase] ligase [Actinopolyspora biskrensis]NYH79355.1 BirA family biotin operon repressor/biotin-[acetyl-CoA-carboxylase] ligase [Actinopolyspora biskrensis]
MSTPPPLDLETLRARLVGNGPYSALDVVTVTGSTNTDLIAAANAGSADRTVLVAEEQQAGRGRMRRSWVSPRHYGLHVSVLLRPVVTARSALSWIPLLAGTALSETVREETGLEAVLKWPNDMLLGSERKAAGILADVVSTLDGMAVVLGIGVNVHHDAADLPAGAGGLPATSLAAEGAKVDRGDLLARLLERLSETEEQWRSGDPGTEVDSRLLERYRNLCTTLGRRVRVEFGGGRVLEGTARDIDEHGRLVVRGRDGKRTPVSAGDVVHLRSAER